MIDPELEILEDDVGQPFVTVIGRHTLPVCEAQLVAMIVVGTVTGGKVCVILEQGVEAGQKLGQMRDFDVLSVLLQHPIVVVKFP